MEANSVGPTIPTTDRVDPVVLPDVATEAHPHAHSGLAPSSNTPEAGQGMLQDVLPEIQEVARKVGGFKKLSEIASQLERSEVGQ